jgi:hypothetical protein
LVREDGGADQSRKKRIVVLTPYGYEFAEEMFGNPDADEATLGRNYLDGSSGYCLLSTGNSLYNLLDKDVNYQPGPNGAEQVSEMWQKVNVPDDTASVQICVAFLSQEFPKFVGTQYNDSFAIKFDESLDYLAQGNLNDLAGINGSDEALKAKAAACKDQTVLPIDCGEWVSINKKKDAAGALIDSALHGELGSIFASTTATSKSKQYGCAGPESSDPKVKCYHGWVPPRVICKNISDDDKGKLRTLRVSVADVGDQYFDSALAVDSIVFSTKTCEDAEGRITPPAVDPDSRVNEL